MNVLIASLTINVRIGFVAFFLPLIMLLRVQQFSTGFLFEIVVLRTLFFSFLFVVFIDTEDAKNTATTLAVATALAPVSASARFIADEHCHRSGDSKLLF